MHFRYPMPLARMGSECLCYLNYKFIHYKKVEVLVYFIMFFRIAVSEPLLLECMLYNYNLVSIYSSVISNFKEVTSI